MDTPTEQQQLDMDAAYLSIFGEEPTGKGHWPWRAVPLNGDWNDRGFFNVYAQPIDLPMKTWRRGGWVSMKDSYLKG